MAYGIWVLLIGLLAAPGSPPVEKPGTFEPDFEAKGAPPHDGAVWTIASEKYAARMTLLDEATRREFIRRHAKSETDPFATAPGHPQHFATFLLDLENKGEERLLFQPLLCRLVVPNGEIRNPLDMATIETQYQMLEQKVPAAYAATERLMFDREVALDPGVRRTGLLVFRVADLAPKRFTVEVRMTTERGDPLGFQVPYRFVKPPKEDRTEP